MEDNFNEDIDYIKKVFSGLLGAKIEVQDNFNTIEKILFYNIVENLDKSYKIERGVLEDGGFNEKLLGDITDPLWSTIEQNLNFIYGKEITSALLWFVLERGPYEDENGGNHNFKKVGDLWEYVKTLF